MAQLRKILLVDDDDDLREALSEQLVMTEDFDVFEADSGATAMQKTKEGLYDLIILDVGLPDTDGRELCRLMRKQGVKAPVLMLTGHDSDADTILGLDAGANDYVTKPFKFPVLLARIRAVLRRASDGVMKTSGPNIIRLGELLMDPDRHLCSWRGTEVKLTVTEFLILQALASRPGMVKNRDQLMDAAYGESIFLDDRTIDSHIKRLRRKLRAHDSDFDQIETLYGIGYKYKTS